MKERRDKRPDTPGIDFEHRPFPDHVHGCYIRPTYEDDAPENKWKNIDLVRNKANKTRRQQLLYFFK